MMMHLIRLKRQQIQRMNEILTDTLTALTSCWTVTLFDVITLLLIANNLLYIFEALSVRMLTACLLKLYMKALVMMVHT